MSLPTTASGHPGGPRSSSAPSGQASGTHPCRVVTSGRGRSGSGGRRHQAARAVGTAWPASSMGSRAASASEGSPPLVWMSGWCPALGRRPQPQRHRSPPMGLRPQREEQCHQR
uniref:Uncharacterized protein n=1 Tax=Arundo donax TaxID=35708 RepID=A0A0A9CQ60_ARUDO